MLSRRLDAAGASDDVSDGARCRLFARFLAALAGAGPLSVLVVVFGGVIRGAAGYKYIENIIFTIYDPF